MLVRQGIYSRAVKVNKLEEIKQHTNFLLWYTKESRDAYILDLVEVTQKLLDDSNKTSDNSKRYPKSVELDYIRYLLP